MAIPNLPPLLFRQYIILALVAGACSARAPWFGAALLAMLVFLPSSWRVPRRAVLGVAFLVGLSFVRMALPEVPDKPTWAAVPRQPLLVEAVVDSASGLPGGRVRVLLRDVRQTKEIPTREADKTDEVRRKLQAPVRGARSAGIKDYAGALFQDDTAALPGLVSLTLDARVLEKTGRPHSGQRMTALLRLYPSGGSGNANTNGASAYWAAREVWHNARLVWHERSPLLITLDDGDGGSFQAAGLRERWRLELTKALAAADESEAQSPEENGASRDLGGFSYEPAPRFSQGRAMLVALLFGDRSELSTRTVDLFTRAGLIHSLALSGQHLALAAMAGVAMIGVMSRIRRGLYLHRPRRILMAWAGLPFALLYLFLGDAPFSLIRAALMMCAGAYYLTRRQASAPLDALVAAGFLLFLGWPAAVFDLSVQLSVLAVAGILLVMPVVRAFREKQSERRKQPLTWLSRAGRFLMREVGTMLLISCAAQLAVLPVLITVFGAVSPCFWLNVLWLPPLTFLTLPFAALGLFLLLIFGQQAVSAVLFSAAAWPADLMLSVLEYLDTAGALPFVQCFRPSLLSSLGYTALLLAMALIAQRWMNGRRSAGSTVIRRVLSWALLLMVAGQLPQLWNDVQAYVERRVELTLIDVGHGQAALLEYPGGRILVDGGGTTSPFFDYGKSVVAPILTKQRLPWLDAVIVSHTDADHARGLRWILAHFRVGALYWSPVSAARADSGEGLALREIARRRGIPERIIRRGEILPLGEGLALEVLAPDIAEESMVPDGKRLSSNAASLVLRLRHEGHGLALLCGDVLSRGLRHLVKSGQNLQTDVLVLPHHGAASSCQPIFYDAVSPQVAMASAAPYNHYDFPSRKVREALEVRGIPLVSTSTSGTLRMRWKRKDDRYVLALPASIP